ncbi:MAG: hypothetical protein D6820_08665 [Lentisphaerae bacterium]|nr:MAG: hypothetical protein D6820_08665 [Lentisphaerota bacterium]
MSLRSRQYQPPERKNGNDRPDAWDTPSPTEKKNGVMDLPAFLHPSIVLTGQASTWESVFRE